MAARNCARAVADKEMIASAHRLARSSCVSVCLIVRRPPCAKGKSKGETTAFVLWVGTRIPLCGLTNEEITPEHNFFNGNLRPASVNLSHVQAVKFPLTYRKAETRRTPSRGVGLPAVLPRT